MEDAVTALYALITMLVALQVTSLATTIYLHRGLSHRGLRFARPADIAFRAWLWLSIGITPRAWVAVHRKHHRFTDVEGDPHSPRLTGGPWRLLLTNYLHYRRETKDPETIARYAKDLPPDRWDRVLFRFTWLGPVVAIALLVLAFGPLLGVATYVLHGVLYILFSASINSLCHWFGYKNFDNTATNIPVIAWLTGGEGWHNNHHAHPSSPRLAMAKGEFDPAWWVVRMLAAARLVELRGEPRVVEGSAHAFPDGPQRATPPATP
jgi:stearoyl-CoA desaturase (delta-9 desaturase)